MEEMTVLCASSAYDKKFYFNEEFNQLPGKVKDELKIICVLFTEDVGGIFEMKFNDEGNLLFTTEADEGDLLYDDIGAALKIKRLQIEKKDTFEAIEMFYKVFFLGEDPEEGSR